MKILIKPLFAWYFRRVAKDGEGRIGGHRIRHYGLLASGTRADSLTAIRILLAMDAPASNKKDAGKADAPAPDKPVCICPCCGGRMIVIETFEGSCRRRRPAPAPSGIDTS